MNVVDSSAWLEYFADGANAGVFAAAIENTTKLLVPSICLFEVFKRVYQQRGEGAALQAVAMMQQGTVVDLDGALALTAARLSADLKLPMADSVVLTTARQYGATLWTQDADFADLDGVRYVAKK
ncbi:MAG: type II toxin-antitoxin system VapC family toxin [Gemmatimonadota bacterium]|nr:type II toxin-antitoxin system VapC family toxin [Gemmatimonadota bacterium]HEU4990758.1 type II toxin-antitoxin system VapC family toxin [Gemmatimonadaceae bacterium]